MAYDPRKPYLSGEQYIHDPDYLAPKLAERVTKDVRTLCTALGYDLNTVEFAIKDDVPYAIDFMNPAPDAELASVGEFYHNWIVSAMTDFIFKKLAEPRTHPRYRWDALLNPELTRTSAVASGTEQQGRTILPNVDGATKTTESAVSTSQPKANAASAAVETRIAGANTETDDASPRTARRAKSETKVKTTGRKSEKNPSTPRSKTTI